jgi:hypothetical protein
VGNKTEKMVDLELLTGGELNAAVTREVVRVHSAIVGRGRKSPTPSTTAISWSP